MRLHAGLTQDELAERMGTTPQQVSRLEKGERALRPRWLQAISAALAVRPGAIIDSSVDPQGVAPGISEAAKGPDEVRLLRAWRAISAADRDLIRDMLLRLSGDEGKPD